MKRFVSIMMVVGCSLVTNEPKAKSFDRLDRQEDCEILCISCLEHNIGEICIQLSNLCCKVNGGTRDRKSGIGVDCGCRIEA